MSEISQYVHWEPDETAHVFIVMNAGASMAGAPLARLNETVPELLSELQRIGNRREFPMAVHMLGYRMTPRWLYGTSGEAGLPPLDVPFADLQAASQADLAPALQELSRALKASGVCQSTTAHVLIVLLTDGQEPMTPDVRQQLAALADDLRAPSSSIHSGPMRMITALNCSDASLPQALTDACAVAAIPDYADPENPDPEDAEPLALPAQEVSRLLACVADSCFILYYS